MNRIPIISLVGVRHGLGVIIEYPSGVVYTDQVGGDYHQTAECEGVFAPLDRQDLYLEEKLSVMPFMPPVGGIKPHLADMVDDLLHGFNATKGMSVDRNRLHECMDGWVYVKMLSYPRSHIYGHSNKGGIYSPIYDFPALISGVLVWSCGG